MNCIFKCLMVIVGDRRILGGDGVVAGLVMSKRQWGFVLVMRDVHDVGGDDDVYGG